MALIPTGHPARLVTRSASGAMEVASFAFNVAATIACAWLATKLWGDAKAYLANAGGMPVATLDYAWRVAQSPGLHLRLMWWTAAWIAAVFSAGATLLAVAGARSLYWRIHAAVRAL